MVDIENLRKNPEVYRKLISSGRGDSSKVDIDAWLKLDEERRTLIQGTEKFQAELNVINKSLQGKPDEETLNKIKNLKSEIESRNSKLESLTSKWQETLNWMPNLYLDEVPQGRGSEDNVELKAWDPTTGYLTQDKLGKENFSGQYMSEIKLNLQ